LLAVVDKSPYHSLTRRKAKEERTLVITPVRQQLGVPGFPEKIRVTFGPMDLLTMHYKLRRPSMRAIAGALLLITFSSLAVAQVPKANVFVGYSFMSADVPNSFQRENLNGWEASLEGKVLPFLGIVADGSGYYGTTATPVCPSAPGFACSPVGGNIHTALFGPRVSASFHGIRPFAHVLVGLGAITGVGSDVSLASGFGGGVDFKIATIIGWRFQGDYIHTHFADNSQGHGRLSTGIVLRF
jgi:hypothetical protein